MRALEVVEVRLDIWMIMDSWSNPYFKAIKFLITTCLWKFLHKLISRWPRWWCLEGTCQRILRQAERTPLGEHQGCPWSDFFRNQLIISRMISQTFCTSVESLEVRGGSPSWRMTGAGAACALSCQWEIVQQVLQWNGDQYHLPRAAGDAYVELETLDDQDDALRMHKRDMGTRYIDCVCKGH